MKYVSVNGIKTTLAAAAIGLSSSSLYAAGAVSIKSATDWDGGLNQINSAGGSISATSQVIDVQSFTSNPALNGAAWAHVGSWYTFFTQETATTTITLTGEAGSLAPAFSVWNTDGEFDGGTGDTGELSTAAKGTPHSFNAVADPGVYGTWWMTDDSVAISDSGTNGGVGFTANGIIELLGYASDGPDQATNGWGYTVSSDGLADGIAELTIQGLTDGWHLIFVGGADGSLSGSNVDITVSSVPVPGAVYLFGTAFAGLFAARRRKAQA